MVQKSRPALQTLHFPKVLQGTSLPSSVCTAFHYRIATGAHGGGREGEEGEREARTGAGPGRRRGAAGL